MFQFCILKLEFSNLTITNIKFQYCNTVIIFLFYSKITAQQFDYQNIICNVCNNISKLKYKIIKKKILKKISGVANVNMVDLIRGAARTFLRGERNEFDVGGSPTEAK